MGYMWDTQDAGHMGQGTLDQPAVVVPYPHPPFSARGLLNECAECPVLSCPESSSILLLLLLLSSASASQLNVKMLKIICITYAPLLLPRAGLSHTPGLWPNLTAYRMQLRGKLSWSPPCHTLWHMSAGMPDSSSWQIVQ
ncbi:uncharacterized protein DMAD_10380 [Drosophila madeirensis]|uniref:Uncharacterized protein n=1 Tax=Drosophila madeirensis TaxID=30013 RepID=A0AAU9F9D9_DROMD